MPEIRFNCKHCGQHIEADEALARTEFSCPSCGKVGNVPAGSQPNVTAASDADSESSSTFDAPPSRRRWLIVTVSSACLLLCAGLLLCGFWLGRRGRPVLTEQVKTRPSRYGPYSPRFIEFAPTKVYTNKPFYVLSQRATASDVAKTTRKRLWTCGIHTIDIDEFITSNALQNARIKWTILPYLTGGTLNKESVHYQNGGIIVALKLARPLPDGKRGWVEHEYKQTADVEGEQSWSTRCMETVDEVLEDFLRDWVIQHPELEAILKQRTNVRDMIRSKDAPPEPE